MKFKAVLHKRKTLVYLMTLASIALLAGIFYISRSTSLVKQKKVYQTTYESTSTNVGTLETKETPPPTNCKTFEGIEYYYYQDLEPSEIKNNKFGIYIYAEVDKYFDLARELVNSNGGDWGYVLIPYNVKDYDYSKWSHVFEMLRDKHLIPIIQLHDLDVDKMKDQTKDAAEFLNGFLWPIRQRYISVYNEPNDDKFWYGDAQPKEYAKVLKYTIETFKDKNKDFYMLNGALNISAYSGGGYIDALEFMRKMNESEPGIFNKLDGWASHSYPQPNFSGFPSNTGRNSIRAYETELKTLKSLGVKKDLPVFITETGWAHAEGNNYNNSYLPEDTVADYITSAYNNYWLKDDRVKAVTPFTIKYDPPYDHFSWLKEDKTPYKHYDSIKELPKVKGTPEKLEKGKIKNEECIN